MQLSTRALAKNNRLKSYEIDLTLIYPTNVKDRLDLQTLGTLI